MKKTISIFRWILLGIIIPGIFALLAYVLFPLAYILRRPLRRGISSSFLSVRILSSILWVFLDDEEYLYHGHDCGPDWWRLAKGLKIYNPWQQFKAAYLWGAVRNPAWNQYYFFHPKFGEAELISLKGDLTQDGIRVSLMHFAVLKYVDSNGNYSDNKGDYLSLVYSILGESMVWYQIDGRLYFRYSFAGYRFGRWWELQLGTNDRRYTFRFKIKKVIVWDYY